MYGNVNEAEREISVIRRKCATEEWGIEHDTSKHLAVNNKWSGYVLLYNYVLVK